MICAFVCLCAGRNDECTHCRVDR